MFMHAVCFSTLWETANAENSYYAKQLQFEAPNRRLSNFLLATCKEYNAMDMIALMPRPIDTQISYLSVKGLGVTLE